MLHLSDPGSTCRHGGGPALDGGGGHGVRVATSVPQELQL